MYSMGILFSKRITPADKAFIDRRYMLSKKYESNILSLKYGAENKTSLSGSGMLVNMRQSNAAVYNDLFIISNMVKHNNAYGISEKLELTLDTTLMHEILITNNKHITDMIEFLMNIHTYLHSTTMHSFMMKFYYVNDNNPIINMPIAKYDIIPLLSSLRKFNDHILIEICKYENMKGNKFIWDMSMITDKTTIECAITDLKNE